MASIRVFITRRDFKSEEHVVGRWNGLTSTVIINHDAVYDPKKIRNFVFKNSLFFRFKKSITIDESMEMSMEERFFFILNHELYHALKTMFWFKFVMTAYSLLFISMISVVLVAIFTSLEGIILCAVICLSGLVVTFLLYKWLKLVEERNANLMARDHVNGINAQIYNKAVNG